MQERGGSCGQTMAIAIQPNAEAMALIRPKVDIHDKSAATGRCSTPVT
jgi:hypothetical protein